LRAFRVIGPGRAGLSLTRALTGAGWTALPPIGRADDVRGAAVGVDLVVIATPDAAVAGVAAAVTPGDAVVAHLAGSLGLDALAPQPRRAAIHPLRSIPTPDTDLGGAWFAIAGDGIAEEVVAALDGRFVRVADADRTLYHAAACIASNHLVALLGQAERVAASAGVPLAAYLDLVRATVDNVEVLGPSAALTGPVARGDWDTVERHRAALAPEELAAYDAMVDAARRLLTPHVEAR
jgi:predicted short-subunit dehydrogenase-like oxidoreductase (DUF2520 family)